MRWEELFADLEGQADAAQRAELDTEVRDRTRRELALLTLADRLPAARGQVLTLGCAGGLTLRGELLDAGSDWLLLRPVTGREALIALTAVRTAQGVARWVDAPEGEVARRLDLRWALRGIARDRSGVQLHLSDGAVLAGTLDRVGADHLDLAEHPPGEARRSREVSQVTVVSLPAVVAVLRSE